LFQGVFNDVMFDSSVFQYLWRSGRQELDDLPARTYVSEYPIESGEHRFVQSVGMPGKGVGDHDHLVTDFGGVTGRRLTADIRYRSGDQQSIDTEWVEPLLQVPLAREEGACARFERNEVTLSLLEFAP
jgi:hypothetical protein